MCVLVFLSLCVCPPAQGAHVIHICWGCFRVYIGSIDVGMYYSICLCGQLKKIVECFGADEWWRRCYGGRFELDAGNQGCVGKLSEYTIGSGRLQELSISSWRLFLSCLFGRSLQRAIEHLETQLVSWAKTKGWLK